VYGSVDSPDGNAARPISPTGRHRPPPMSAALALGLTVGGLVAAIGLGSALLPASLTGPGTPAELPAAAVAALAPGAGGGAPGVTATPSSAPASPSATPSRTVKRSVKPKPTRTKATPTPTATKRPTTAATTRTAIVGSGQDAQEDEVIRLVNIERDKAGCGSVKLDTRLRTAIRLHVQEVGEHDFPYLSHVSDDGRDFVARARAQGYDAAGGENIARGQRDAAEVMDSWMHSDGHRANILNCSFKAIGVGRIKAEDDTLVWGQLFGRS